MNRERTLEQGSGSVILFGRNQQLAQINHAQRNSRMFVSELLLVDRQRPFKKRTGLFVLLLLFVQHGQVADAHGHRGM